MNGSPGQTEDRPADAGAPVVVGAARPVIHALTGIRAVALIWVIATHLGEALYLLFPGIRVLEPVLSNGHLAVDTFFMLSGFIISYNYAARLATLDRRGYRDFIRARIARIYPAYLFALCAMALVVVVAIRLGSSAHPGQEFSVLGFVGNALLLQAVPGVTPWNWPSWSVSTEFAAYLIFPVVAFAIHRARRRTAILLIAAVLVVEFALLMVPMEASLYMVALMWVRITGSFTVGCLLWVVWRHGIQRHWRWDLMATVSLALVLALAAIAPIPPMPWAALPLLAVFVISVASSTSAAARVLGSRPMEWLGRLSYSVYLLHSPVLAGIWLFYPPGAFVSSSLAMRIAVPLAWLAAVLVAGVVTYYVVEEPGRRFLRRRRGPGRADPGAAPATDATGSPDATPSAVAGSQR